MMRTASLTVLALLLLAVPWRLAAAERPFPEFRSTGLIPGERDGGLVVRAVFPNSPAGKAGLRAGDRIAEVRRERGAFEKVSMENLSQCFFQLNTPREPTVGLRLANGREHELEVVPLELTANNRPRGNGLPSVRVTEIDGFEAYANAGFGSGICKGDQFFLLQNGKRVAMAEAQEVERNRTHLRIDLAKSVKMPADIQALRGAEVVLCRASTQTVFELVHAYQVKQTALRQQVETFKREHGDDTQMLFGEVRNNPRAQGHILMRIAHGSSSPGGLVGPNTMGYNVTFGNAVTYHIRPDGRTRYISMTNVEADGRASFNDLKEGSGIDIWVDKDSRKQTTVDGELVVEYTARLVVIK